MAQQKWTKFVTEIRKKRRILDPYDDKTTRFDKMTLLTTLDG